MVLSLLCGLLLRLVGVVYFVGWAVADRRVEPSRIVSGFDVPGNVVHRGAPGRVGGAVDEFVLQAGEERFGHRVVLANPGTPD